MIVIVGLGNPGKNYERTIHNLGFMMIDYFAQYNNLSFSKSKYYGRVAEGVIDGEKVILLKPETFMNLSGKSVEDVVHSLKVDPNNILVIVDDIDLDFGSIRLRSKGSAGTHNGMRDIVAKIGENFPRVRIGAGRPEHVDLIDYVLSRIPDDKMQVVESNYPKVEKIIKYFIKNKTIEGIDINNL